MDRKRRMWIALLTGLTLLSACARTGDGGGEPSSVSVTAETTGRPTENTTLPAPAASTAEPSEQLQTGQNMQTGRNTTSAAVRQTGTSAAPQTTAKTATTAKTSAADPVRPSAAVWTENSLQTTDGSLLRYYLYTPSDAVPDMPLIVYLHGGSGKGDDLSALLALDGFPRYLHTGELGDVRAYVAIPQLSAAKKGWADISAALYTLTEKLSADGHIDHTRIALTGHSMGGTGSWNLALRYPTLFARVAPLSGSVRYTAESVSALKGTAVWAFVGGADTIVPQESSRAFVAALQKSGNAKLTEFDGADHFSVPALAYLSEDRALLRFLTFTE